MAEGDFLARNTDGETSHLAAETASKSQLNAIFHQQLYEAGRNGKTTMAMARDTNRPRDSFSPRYSQNKRTVAKIGKRYEPNASGKLVKLDVYCLKIFLIPEEPPYPPLLGWQVLKKEP